MKIISIISSSKSRMPKNVELAGYKCECGQRFEVVSGIEEPFCPNCGSSTNTPVEKASKSGKALVTLSDDKLACFVCPTAECASTSIMRGEDLDKVLTELGHLHCPVCSTEVSFPTQADAGKLEPRSQRLTDTRRSNTILDRELKGQKLNTLPVSLADLEGDISFTQVGDTVTACRDGVPFAVSRNQPTGSADALNTVCHNDDFVLGDNFEVLSVDVPIEGALQDLVDKSLAEIRAKQRIEFGRNIDAVGASYKQSVEIALMGIPRGMFKTKGVLANVITDTLAANDVNPEIAQAILAGIMEHSDDITNEIHEVASELVTKSDETRNELAETAASLPIVQTVGKPSVEREIASPLRPSTKTTSVVKEEANVTAPKTRVAELAQKFPFRRGIQ